MPNVAREGHSLEESLQRLEQLTEKARSPEAGIDEAIGCLEEAVQVLKEIVERVEEPVEEEASS